MSVKYSIIIPSYNEEIYIKENLEKLLCQKDIEIIIADGGSCDNTLAIADKYKVKITKSSAGRGIQINEGVKSASGEILCFLHADTALPANAFDLLNKFFENKKNKICRFKLGFDIDHWLLDKYKFFSQFDSVFTRFGDSFIAVRRDFYKELGGFPDWINFEDVEFLRKASRMSKVYVIDAEVITSARRFTTYGLINQQIYSGYLIIKYLLGFRKFIDKNEYNNRRPKNNKVSLILFVRYPQKGKVKTRLAASIGHTRATVMYKLITEEVINSASKIKNSNMYIFYSDKNEKNKIRNWLGRRFFYAFQSGLDLGSRMTNAFRKVFSLEAKKTIILGTDIPGLSKEIIDEAVSALEEHDIVIGPANDGGYYLLGMKEFLPSIFENIHYSTSTVLAETIEKIKTLNKKYYMLKTIQDIDTEADLKNWLSKSSSGNQKLASKINAIYAQEGQ